MTETIVTDEDDNKYVVDEEALSELPKVEFIDAHGTSEVGTGTEFTITTDTKHDGKDGDLAVMSDDLDDYSISDRWDFEDINLVE